MKRNHAKERLDKKIEELEAQPMLDANEVKRLRFLKECQHKKYHIMLFCRECKQMRDVHSNTIIDSNQEYVCGRCVIKQSKKDT